MKKILLMSLMSFMIIGFTACGEGGGGSDSSSDNGSSTPPVTAPTTTGTFVDDPVEGLKYTCSTGEESLTNHEGQYTCSSGSDVTMYVGEVYIGTVATQSNFITPYSFFPNNTVAAINLARLLQSLDADGDVNNGFIKLDITLANQISKNQSFSSTSFTNDIESTLNISLVTPSEAQDRLNNSIIDLGGSIPNGGNIPIADAGTNQNIHTQSTVLLDGTKSTDADGDSLTYKWKFISTPIGSLAYLDNTSTPIPSFIADSDGAYIIQLIVNDGTVDSAASTVTITASTENSAPVADAGVNQNVNTTSTATLNGSASSDADSDQLTYSWSIISKPAGSNATLTNPTIVNPTFVADLDGIYLAQLVVNDGTVDSSAVTVTITATTANSAPVADAGIGQNIDMNNLVKLDGSGSADADGDALSYLWNFVSKPSGSSAIISDATVVNPTFVADKSGSYAIQLIVNDGQVGSSPATVAIITSIYVVTHVSTTSELRVALANAAQNSKHDKIILADGIYKTTDDGGGVFDYNSASDKTLLITGSDALNTVLDGDNTNQVIQHYSSASSKLIIENISIINGKSNGYGGGVYTYESIEVIDCNISNNRAEGNLGGAIMARGYGNKIINSTITHNYAADGSGGIHFSKTGEVYSSTISYNNSPLSVEGGVGITAGDGLKIYDSNITHNSGAYSGAAVKLYDYNLIIDGSIIQYNTSGGSGPVISSTTQSMIITNSIISNNTPSFE